MSNLRGRGSVLEKERQTNNFIQTVEKKTISKQYRGSWRHPLQNGWFVCQIFSGWKFISLFPRGNGRPFSVHANDCQERFCSRRLKIIDIRAGTTLNPSLDKERSVGAAAGLSEVSVFCLQWLPQGQAPTEAIAIADWSTFGLSERICRLDPIEILTLGLGETRRLQQRNKFVSLLNSYGNGASDFPSVRGSKM